MGVKRFLDMNRYEAALERIDYVFDHFENINVSISSGKDSTVSYWLAINEAMRRGRKITVLFLDQEAEYQASIDLMQKLMRHPSVIPEWYQVPLYMTTATTYKTEFLYAWGPGETWMRDKDPLAIHAIDDDYPRRFYQFFDWNQDRCDDTAFIIGLRAGESINRYRAVTKRAGYRDVLWSTKTNNPTTFKFYPIYDWGIGDVWKYIADNNIEYNAIYDKMFAANHNYYNTMRVSNLIHEKSFKCLADLQKLEPDTYNRLLKRLDGVHCAARYISKGYLYSPNELPEHFSAWLEYRNYLLETTPYNPEDKERFTRRFAGQEQTEHVYRQQVKQLLIDDRENNVPVVQHKADHRRDVLDKWYSIL